MDCTKAPADTSHPIVILSVAAILRGDEAIRAFLFKYLIKEVEKYEKRPVRMYPRPEAVKRCTESHYKRNEAAASLLYRTAEIF